MVCKEEGLWHASVHASETKNQLKLRLVTSHDGTTFEPDQARCFQGVTMIGSHSRPSASRGSDFASSDGPSPNLAATRLSSCRAVRVLRHVLLSL